MLKKTKQSLLRSARLCGLFDLTRKSRWRQNKLLILGYHGISLEDEHLWNSRFYMTSDFLRRRFEIIREHGCTVLPLNEALERLHQGTLPQAAVVITFDDGSYDFYHSALPIIKEFNFPVTLYLTTFYTHFNRPVFDVAADYFLWKAGSKTLNCSLLLGLDENINLTTESERLRALSLIRNYALINRFSAGRKNELLEAMCAELEIDYAEFCRKRILHLMNSNEISTIAHSCIDVQLHTHRHRVPADEKLFHREIDDNRRVIEDATGRQAVHFCYPNGEHNSQFFPWLRTANIISATTCQAGLSTPQSNPFLLPRLVDSSSLSEVEFMGWLSGVSQFVPQRRNS